MLEHRSEKIAVSGSTTINNGFLSDTAKSLPFLYQLSVVELVNVVSQHLEEVFSSNLLAKVPRSQKSF